MPIRAEVKHKYPADWKAIRARILERDGNRCKWCGAENHQFVTRDKNGKPQRLTNAEAEVAKYVDGEKVTFIVLTIAHLDHGLEDHSDANLAALCQRCHLGHDAKQHAAQAKLTRDAKRGQGRLVFE